MMMPHFNNSNASLNGSASAPTLNPTPNADAGEFPYCVAVVENNTGSTLYVGLLTFDRSSSPKPVSYEIKRLTATDTYIFVGLDDTVASVKVFTDPTKLTYTVGQTTMTCPTGDAYCPGGFWTNHAYRFFQASVDGRVVKTNRTTVYASTDQKIEILNRTNGSLCVSIDGVVVPPLPNTTTYPTGGKSGVPVTIGIENDPSIPTAMVTLYDTSQSKVTVTGPGPMDAQPLLVSGEDIAVYNDTGQSIEIWGLGMGTKKTQIETGELATLSVDNATASWYLHWEETQDPKVIVKRPATVQTSR